jgi:iron complex transport system substrate-binding protein
MKVRIAFLVCLLLLLALLPAAAQETPSTVDCLTAFDPAVDYFPDKARVEYASGFSIEYFNAYKVLTVTSPWPGATEADAFRYLLLQCGAPRPEGFEEVPVITIPTQRLIAMSTSYLPHIVQLGLVDRLIGVDSAFYINTPEVVAKAEAGDLLEVGFGSGVNVEQVLDSESDLVMTFGSGTPEFDAHPALIAAGVPVVVNGEWMEPTPLGRAEWIKFTAAFFNAEAAATTVFDAEAARYNDLAGLAAEVPPEEQPSVLWGLYFGDSWAIPGGQSFVAALMQAAGARLILSDSPEAADVSGSVPFDFEAVFDAGQDADFWLPGAFGVTDLASFIAQDARYAEFAAVANGAVWNNDLRVNANGGNDIYESGVTNPSGVLADLLHLFHPALLPDHQMLYLRQLG